MTEQALPRITGEEQAKACPNCGGPRTLIHNVDGSSAPAPCPQCFGQASREATIQQTSNPPSTDTAQVLPVAPTIPTIGQNAAEEALPHETGTTVAP